MALCWTLDKLGPMCRTADDCGLVLAAMAGQDPKDPTTVAGGFDYTPGPRARRPRIGVVRNATARNQPEVQGRLRAARWRSCARSPTSRTTSSSPTCPYGPAVGIIVDAEGAAAFRDLIESGNLRKLREKADRWGGYPMMMTLAADYIDAMRVRVPMRKALDELLGRYDALVTPTRTAVAPPIGYDFDKPPQPPRRRPPPPTAPRPPSTIPAGNLAGLPALCVPNGFGQHGLPTSLQFLGRAFSEATLIDLGDRYQNATGWHLKRPPMDKLADAPPKAPRARSAEFDEPGRPDLYRL